MQLVVLKRCTFALDSSAGFTCPLAFSDLTSVFLHFSLVLNNLYFFFFFFNIAIFYTQILEVYALAEVAQGTLLPHQCNCHDSS
jgi:hypothetical protein